MPPRLALPPGRFENPGAGLEPKKQYENPFAKTQRPQRSDCRQHTYIVTTHPKGQTTIKMGCPSSF